MKFMPIFTTQWNTLLHFTVAKRSKEFKFGWENPAEVKQDIPSPQK